jgi:hypothetical protein
MNTTKKMLVVIGLVGLGTALASPAFAKPQAYASGSSSFVLTSGFSQSIGAEIAAPQGNAFDGATATTGDVTATVTFIDNTSPLAETANVFATFNLDPGQADGAVSVAANVEAAVAERIFNGGTAALGTTDDDAYSLIRSWQSGLD